MPHEREQPIRRTDGAVEIARGVIWVDILPVALQMRLAHLRERPRRRRYHALGAVACQVTEQAAVHELQVCALSPDARPLRAAEAANPRPVFGFQVAHAMEQDVQ